MFLLNFALFGAVVQRRMQRRHARWQVQQLIVVNVQEVRRTGALRGCRAKPGRQGHQKVGCLEELRPSGGEIRQHRLGSGARGAPRRPA